MKIIGIIPARYASSRFPGKPLTIIQGKPMIHRVYEQAIQAKTLTDVFVATDDERIAKVVQAFGGNVILTSNKHKSGTDRCYEVVEQLKSKDNNYDVVINIQGDEPFIDPKQIELVSECFTDTRVEIATLVKKITKSQELFNPNINKVVFNQLKNAIYFSRHPIPYIQGVDQSKWLDKHTFYKHIGIYAYRADILKKITGLKISSLEKAESLEQLRWLEHGYIIRVEETGFESIAVDIPDDLLKFSNNT
ncbi:MAG: 3-deoxy-manno-octulosonate cytidylyltransferase [Bacteroidales bacterium]|nr:3-deoxy-manno-octulosonate cytidylyltransferase [Bacteroidales bacterium]